MSDIICVTNRRLCKGDFIERIESIARAGPKAVILREKDLGESEYAALARRVMAVCKRYFVPCIPHTFYDIALDLGADSIHLPLPVLRSIPQEKKTRFRVIGSSCHSADEALEAQELGASYVTAGHVFATDCKKGLPPRGLGFLSELCRAVSIPVYAIGGVSAENISDVLACGAAGACVMGAAMSGSFNSINPICENPRFPV